MSVPTASNATARMPVSDGFMVAERRPLASFSLLQPVLLYIFTASSRIRRNPLIPLISEEPGRRPGSSADEHQGRDVRGPDRGPGYAVSERPGRLPAPDAPGRLARRARDRLPGPGGHHGRIADTRSRGARARHFRGLRA